jgi:hypothetical protein
VERDNGEQRRLTTIDSEYAILPLLDALKMAVLSESDDSGSNLADILLDRLGEPFWDAVEAPLIVLDLLNVKGAVERLLHELGLIVGGELVESV